MRELRDEERQALVDLSTGLSDQQREQFLADVRKSLVSEATADGSRLRFHLEGYDRPAYRGQHAYPVGGTMRDSDGTEISVTVFADENDRILELELVKWSDSSIMAPDWRTFRLTH